jgi:hypothetical protein
MATIASTQDEWAIHALNIHGVFFERRCTTLVADTTGWAVLATNYPVEFPPPNGPWRGKESSLDIWARRVGDPSFVVDALIECKKANPEFVNWVFFPKPDSPLSPASSPFGFAWVDNRLNAAGSEPWSTQVSVRRGTTTVPVASDAREVRGDYTKHQGGNRTKTSNAAIQDAAYQVALATRAVVHEEVSLLGKACKSPDHPAPPWMSAHFSDRGRPFQADRGRQIGAAVDAQGKHASPGLNVAQSSTISLKRPPGWATTAAVLG